MATSTRAADTTTNVWSVDIRFASDSSPALGTDGTVYFGTWDGKLWALSRDGATKWVFPTGREIKSSPAVGADGTIYVGSRDRKFYAVRPEGKKRWDFLTGGWVDGSAALGNDGTIYFGSWDKCLYALNPDGSKKWQFQTGGEINSSAAIDAAGRIYFGSHDQRLYALEPDGKKAWDYATGGPILSSPALDQNGNLFFTSVDGSFYALNHDGGLRWRLQTGGITETSPVIGLDGTLYLGVNDRLWAVSADGKKLWDQPTEDRDLFIESTPATLSDGSVLFVSRYGMLNDLGPDRKSKWSFYLYGHGYASPNIGPTGTVFTSGEWTNFFALQASAPLAQSPWPKFRADSRNTGNVKAPEK